jgi:hypothetical protein
LIKISKKNYFIFISLFLILVIYIALSIHITNLSIKATKKISDQLPSSYDLQYENLQFRTSDNFLLKGWFIENSNLQTVIIIHGVDSNRSDGFTLDLIKDIYDMGYSVMTFDLRAHGDSEGRDLGLTYVERDDINSAIKYVEKTKNVEEIVLFGLSYGGTIALSNTDLSPSIKGIVSDSPFYDLPELLANEVSNRTFIPKFIANLLKFGIIQTIRILHDIETIQIISRIQSVENFHNPILIYHCEQDERIPISHSKRISKFLPEKSTFKTFDNCEHAKGYEENKQEYNNILQNYLDYVYK